ncbi:hypothetical protein RN001_002782 [Aquatica leii]|uniref:protein-histidine N-methyltransferase n=1 Tax=Aquatica leii TaxID=1421715 RepID=A0AAN7PMT8_9COLE|nr:hypothetical protein RN001_002782 [Aquatica leii]
MGRKNHNKPQKSNVQHKQSSNERKLHDLVDQLLRLTTTQSDQNLSQSVELYKQINEVIIEIQLLENGNELMHTSKNRLSAAILSKFTNWIVDNGATFDGLKISEFPGYELGLMAERDIKQSSLIITVPKKLMITIDIAKKSELRRLIEKDPLLSNMSNVTLAMFLLLEKFKENSFWKPYIDILPTEYSTVLYFNLEDLQELQVSPTLESALKQIKNIARQYAYFFKLIWNSDDSASHMMRKNFTFNKYRWAVSTVMTRQNTIPTDDGTKLISALIPLWDLCNHTNGNISTDYNPNFNRSECLALRDFKAGEQIFIFYGPRSNAELFIHNGFVCEDNIHDGFWLKLGVSKSDPLKCKKEELLKKLSLPDHGEFLLRNTTPPVDGQLLAFLRIFNMDTDQLSHWIDQAKPENLQNLECAFDTFFEQKYWGFLLTRLKLILATYKSSIEVDEKLLTNEISPNKSLAIKMRISEKRILESVINYAEQRIRS